LSIFDAKHDILSHELAHQWWGGLISWKTPDERWITEGLATYSSLISLRAWRGEKEYQRALARLRRHVKRYAGKGTTVEGYKLLLDKQNPKIFQALVYGKPALMLTALAEKIGEGELCARLKALLRDRRKSCLETAEFLLLLAGGDKQMQEQLKKWILDRGLPDGL